MLTESESEVETKYGRKLLEYIMSSANSSINYPFLYEVDTIGLGLTDYYDIIREPMWLDRMHEKFNDCVYQSLTEFVSDFRLMLFNCYRYNGVDSYVSKLAHKLENLFEQRLLMLPFHLRPKTSMAAVFDSLDDPLDELDSNQNSNGSIKRRAASMGSSLCRISLPNNSSNSPMFSMAEEIQLSENADSEESMELKCNRIVDQLRVWERKRLELTVLDTWLSWWNEQLTDENSRSILNNSFELVQIFQLVHFSDSVLGTSILLTPAIKKHLGNRALMINRNIFDPKYLSPSNISMTELESAFLLNPSSSSFLAALIHTLLTPSKDRQTWLKWDIQNSSLIEISANVSECVPPYAKWNSDLRRKIDNWYTLFHQRCKHQYDLVVSKLKIDPHLFKVLGVTNPLESKMFHELTAYQRIVIVKALFEHLISAQEFFVSNLDRTVNWELGLREKNLGEFEDWVYFHFPNYPSDFCSRIFRHPIYADDTMEGAVGGVESDQFYNYCLSIPAENPGSSQRLPHWFLDIVNNQIKIDAKGKKSKSSAKGRSRKASRKSSVKLNPVEEFIKNELTRDKGFFDINSVLFRMGSSVEEAKSKTKTISNAKAIINPPCTDEFAPNNDNSQTNSVTGSCGFDDPDDSSSVPLRNSEMETELNELVDDQKDITLQEEKTQSSSSASTQLNDQCFELIKGPNKESFECISRDLQDLNQLIDSFESKLTALESSSKDSSDLVIQNLRDLIENLTDVKKIGEKYESINADSIKFIRLKIRREIEAERLALKKEKEEKDRAQEALLKKQRQQQQLHFQQQQQQQRHHIEKHSMKQRYEQEMSSSNFRRRSLRFKEGENPEEDFQQDERDYRYWDEEEPERFREENSDQTEHFNYDTNKSKTIERKRNRDVDEDYHVEEDCSNSEENTGSCSDSSDVSFDLRNWRRGAPMRPSKKDLKFAHMKSSHQVHLGGSNSTNSFNQYPNTLRNHMQIRSNFRLNSPSNSLIPIAPFPRQLFNYDFNNGNNNKSYSNYGISGDPDIKAANGNIFRLNSGPKVIHTTLTTNNSTNPISVRVIPSNSNGLATLSNNSRPVYRINPISQGDNKPPTGIFNNCIPSQSAGSAPVSSTQAARPRIFKIRNKFFLESGQPVEIDAKTQQLITVDESSIDEETLAFARQQILKHKSSTFNQSQQQKSLVHNNSASNMDSSNDHNMGIGSTSKQQTLKNE